MTNEAPIDQLLVQWRAARHPSTSALIQQLGDQLRVEVPRLPAKKSDATRALLNAFEAAPAFLRSARLRQLEQFARTTSATVLWPLFEALSKVEPDPRIATLATRLLVGDVEVPLTSKLTRRLLDCVETHGDDSHFRALELGFPLHLLDDGLAARTVRLLQRGLATRPGGPEVPLAERKRILTTKWELPAPPAPLASLYAPIWADPHELARRQVLADLLLERGDPRGEFISLQLADASPKRQKQLLKAHREAWLGKLVSIVDLKDDRPVFEGGFVSELTVKGVRKGQFLLASDAPEWATVRRVRRGLQAFSRSMVGLEDTGPVRLEALRGLVREKLPLKLRSVVVAGFPDEVVDVLEELESPPKWLALHFGVFEPTRELRDALPRLTDLPKLERLRFSAEAGSVMPALLGQMGLEWLPRNVTRLELRDGERLIIFEREATGWVLELLDQDAAGPSRSAWKDLLSSLTWFKPVSVKVSVSRLALDETGQALQQLAGRFGVPVTLAQD